MSKNAKRSGQSPMRTPKGRHVGSAAVVGGLAALLATGGLAAVAIPADASTAVTLSTAHASASAQSPTGTVTAIDASKNTFTMKTTSGSTVDITVTSATKYTEDSGTAKFADLKVGGGVAVIGTGSSSAVTASVVIIGKASSSSGSGGSSGGPGGGGPGGGGGFGGGTFGTVSSVDSSNDSFVVKEFSGTSITVKVSKSTTYVDRAKSSAGFSDVTKGIRVAVTGTTSSGTEDAKTVLILGSGGPGGGGFGGGGGGGGFGGGTFGTVSSVDSSKDSFVLKESSGTSITVKVTKSTTYRDGSKTSANFSDVTKGATVAVMGTTSSGTETATSVIIGGAVGGGGFGGFGGGLFGTVSSVDSSKDQFVLKESSGTTVTVQVSKSTTYFDSSVKSASFSNVTKGATVSVTGTVSSGTDKATSVRIGTFRRPGGAPTN